MSRRPRVTAALLCICAVITVSAPAHGATGLPRATVSPVITARPASPSATGPFGLTVTAGGLSSQGATWHYVARYPIISSASLPPVVVQKINATIRAEFAAAASAGFKFEKHPLQSVADPGSSVSLEQLATSADEYVSLITYSVRQNGPRFLSILVSTDYYPAYAAHQDPGVEGLTFDLLDGSRLDDLFAGGTDYIDAIGAPAGRALTCPPAPELADAGPRFSVADELRYFESDHGSFAITLTPSGIDVDIADGIVLAYVCGPQHAHISYGPLNSILSSDVIAGEDGTSVLNQIADGTFGAAALGLPASVNAYRRTVKKFSVLDLWTRGFLPYNCLHYGTPCLSITAANLRPEATAQALTVRKLSQLSGVSGAPRAAPGGTEPIATDVDWETLFPVSAQAAPGVDSRRGSQSLNADVITDGRGSFAGLLEVKRWNGPETEKTVIAQLGGYVGRAASIGIRLNPSGQLQQSHWISQWIQPNVDDPLNPSPEEVWWVWAGRLPGHVYFARGEYGRRQAEEQNPGAAAEAPTQQHQPQPRVFPLPQPPWLNEPGDPGGGPESPVLEGVPLEQVPLDEAPLVEAGASSLADSLSAGEVLAGLAEAAEAVAPDLLLVAVL